MLAKRDKLKEIFNPTNNSVPTVKDYMTLIESVLNMREDRFYGVWRSNAAYYNEAIVFHKEAFYVLETASEPYCEAVEPVADKHWSRISETVADEDWIFSEDKKSLYAYDKVEKVGIGTKCPDAMLDVKSKGKGQIKLQPNLKDPRIAIVNEDPDCSLETLTMRVSDKSSDLETDSPKGFYILKKNKKLSPPSLIANFDAAPTGEPRVAIGCDSPKAHFEVHKTDIGKVSVDGGEQNKAPSVKISKKGKTKLILAANDTEAVLKTVDAEQGLQIKKNLDEGEETLMTVANNGNIGIGTTEPHARLHIETPDSRDGVIKLGFCSTYPVLQLVNDRVPSAVGTYNNSFSVGASMDAAILKTDSDNGFEFKKTAKTPANAHVVSDMNEGETLVRILPKGTMTVGKDLNDSPFQFDMSGASHATSSYLLADRQQINVAKCQPIESVLERICDLKPVQFEWKNPPLGDKKVKLELGLLADEVKTQFPEVVYDHSVAYQNLVPVLVKAIQEQQETIRKMEKRLCELEKKHKPHNSSSYED